MLAFHFNFNAKYAHSVPSLALACIQLFVVGTVGTIASLLLEQWPDQITNETWIWVALRYHSRHQLTLCNANHRAKAHHIG